MAAYGRSVTSLVRFLGTGALSTSFATRTQQGWATPPYAAPEQYRDFRRTDARTDIFALGVLIWELFTSGWPPLIRDRSGLPEDLNRVFLKSTEHEPTLRFQSVEELSDALESTEFIAQVNERDRQ